LKHCNGKRKLGAPGLKAFARDKFKISQEFLSIRASKK
jgi:hypothetical protein